MLTAVDPSGQTVWTEDVIVNAVQFDRTAQGGKIDGRWQIVLERSGRRMGVNSVCSLSVSKNRWFS